MASTPSHKENQPETVELQQAVEEIVGIDIPEINLDTQGKKTLGSTSGQRENPNARINALGNSKIVPKPRINKGFKKPEMSNGQKRVEYKANSRSDMHLRGDMSKKIGVNTPAQPVVRQRISAPYVTRSGRTVFPTGKMKENNG